MIINKFSNKYSIPPALTYFVVLSPIVNLIALLQGNYSPLFIFAQIFACIYVLLAPGLFLLPFLSHKKFPFALGIALSVALSVFMLMVAGLLINTLLPILGITAPLTTIPLLLTFDAIVLLLFTLNAIFKKDFPLEISRFTKQEVLITCVLVLLPILACIGAVRLNNGANSLVTMIALCLVAVMAVVLLSRDKVNPAIPPIALYMIAFTFLLMNSMRGWFITGHDILLEYHVFTLTAEAGLWNMAFYQDPYNACLSLTILPTYLQSFIHTNPAYIFKFFIQFIGALPVVAVYYLTKQYLSGKLAFLASFLYITFPTFMVDMAFLNRQGIAFLFFGLMILTLLSTEYFSGKRRTAVLVMLGMGMIFSHYSTSYVAVPVLIGAYIINRLMRILVNAKRPRWLASLFGKLGNKVMYSKPILITLPFVLSLLVMMVLWSSVITKTSSSFVDTIEQVMVSLKDPFKLDEQTGPAKYSLVKAPQPTPEELLNRFIKHGIEKQNVTETPTEFYPQSITKNYRATPVPELLAPVTPIGQKVEARFGIDLDNFYDSLKQAYAKILQVLLIIGLAGLVLGYSFKRNILRELPIEYIALSISGVAVMVGQTILPATAINYGLLRLFQQNLFFLVLPIFLGLFLLVALIFRSIRGQIVVCTAVLIFFFLILSGIVPQITGGGRPLLFLNNKGLYYDSYYTHAEEVASTQWIAQYKAARLPIQAAHFSDIKMIAYGHIGAYIELLPETTKKDSFVYLNYDNVKSNNILEIIYGDVVYYHFPMEFLDTYKNRIYSNGGSEIYR